MCIVYDIKYLRDGLEKGAFSVHGVCFGETLNRLFWLKPKTVTPLDAHEIEIEIQEKACFNRTNQWPLSFAFDWNDVPFK